ncbi:MAG TPA: glycine oxidase ThiO [Candidatus Acidoferrum sp.]|nr:glycine oxidase ThiO [Candidatus Acidoferrum sp.]
MPVRSQNEAFDELRYDGGMKKFDVAIAGGGLIGASIALELARAGLRVGVFDRQEPGREASWAGAGILSPAPENPGMIPAVPLSKASLALYPEFVSMVEEISGQHVGFRPKGTVEALFSRDARAELSTLIALHHGLGLKAEPLRTKDARELEPALSEEMEVGILRPEEASVDSRLLTRAVLDAARCSGAEIFPGCGVESLWRESGKHRRCSGVILRNEKTQSTWTVVAAGCFSAGLKEADGYAPVRPAKGQMVALRADELKIERVLWSENIYLVPRDDGRILAGATIEHVGFDKEITAGSIEKILSGAIELAPGLATARIDETWAGLRPDSPDHLPIVGPTDLDGLLIATGHFRSGILLAPITARLIREWITEQRVSLDWERFSPLRFQGQATKKTTA